MKRSGSSSTRSSKQANKKVIWEISQLKEKIDSLISKANIGVYDQELLTFMTDVRGFMKKLSEQEKQETTDSNALMDENLTHKDKQYSPDPP
eukprot:UN04446